MQVAESTQPHSSAGRKYDFVSGAVILLFLVLLFRIREHLPVFQDSIYHLGVIRAFSERGLTLHAWWEFAPFGRPHLYAPLFHLIYLGIYQLSNLDLTSLGQIYDVLTFPLILLTGWWAARLLFGPRAAFLTLLLIALNVGLLYPYSLIMMPGTYVMMVWPFVPILVIRRKTFGAALLLTAMFYFHYLVAGAAILSLIVLVLFRREYLRTALIASVIASVCFSPWLIHMFLHREFMHPGVSTVPAFTPMFSVLAGILGVVAVVKHRDREGLAMLSVIIASGFFLVTIPERFWTYGGFLFAIIGGYGMEKLLKNHVRWVMIILILSALSITPFFKRWQTRLGLPIACHETPLIMGTPFLTLLQWQTPEKQAQLPPPFRDDMLALARWITETLPADEIILTDDEYLGACLFDLTGHPTTTGLWNEIATAEWKQKLATYYETSPGYVILSAIPKDADKVPPKAAHVTTFGRFRIYYRHP